MKFSNPRFLFILGATSCIINLTNASKHKTKNSKKSATSQQQPNFSDTVILPDQTFAFCGLSTCWVYNDVAYCKCYIKDEDSISLTLESPQQGNATTINEAGVGNGYMLSTFYNSPAANKATENPTMAVYNCPDGSTGAYAQCDGAFCFNSATAPASYPSFGQLQSNEIMCSCPITYYVAGSPPFQIGGPFDSSAKDGCTQSIFNDYCGPTQNLTSYGTLQNGDTIAVGAPNGGAKALGEQLASYQNVTYDGFNTCKSSTSTSTTNGSSNKKRNNSNKKKMQNGKKKGNNNNNKMTKKTNKNKENNKNNSNGKRNLRGEDKRSV